jgi:hypothetical protein
MDVMVRAGIDVELCKVMDPSAGDGKKGKKKSQSRTPREKEATVIESESEDEQPMRGLDEDNFRVVALPEDGELPTPPTPMPKNRKRKRRDPSPEV